MAKVKLNSLLADLRGRLGSVVFSSNAAGLYCSIYKPPISRNTNLTRLPRQNFSTLISSWNYLTPTQRSNWSTYAAQADNERTNWFGDPYFPSSRDQFISINTARLQAGASLTDTPPSGSLPLALPAFSAGVYATGAASHSFIDPDAAFDSSIAFVHAAAVISYSTCRDSAPSNPRYLCFPAVGYAWPYDLQSLLETVYGIIPNTGSWWIRLYPVSSEYRFGTAVYYTESIGTEV